MDIVPSTPTRVCIAIHYVDRELSQDLNTAHLQISCPQSLPVYSAFADMNNNRSWFCTYFLHHPDYVWKAPHAYSSTNRSGRKVKVWCGQCLHSRIEVIMQLQMVEVVLGNRATVQTQASIIAERECGYILWSLTAESVCS